jgi:hypothetical protein
MSGAKVISLGARLAARAEETESTKVMMAIANTCLRAIEREHKDRPDSEKLVGSAVALIEGARSCGLSRADLISLITTTWPKP